MRAVLSTAPGGPDTLTVADLPDPSPGPGEALVRVLTVGLNFFDTLIIADRYQVKPERPFSPGGECAGVVEALGDRVKGWRVGDRVSAFLGFNGCRERVVVPADRLLRVPDGVSDEEAAGLTVTGGTALHALKDRAGLQPGESLAVLGAAGGTGLAAVEIGRLLGARVIACASSEDKVALARAHGADQALNYAAEDLKEGLRRLTGGRGVDVVFDPVGGNLAEPAIRAMARAGRYLVVGFTGGIPSIPLNLVLLKGCDLRGVFWGAWTEREPAAFSAGMADLLAHVAAGRLTVPIDRVVPLEGTAEALAALARREAKGKLIVRVGERLRTVRTRQSRRFPVGSLD